MHLAKVVGWKQGETPTVTPGLKIEALARDIQHPRSIYVLPNGDILLIESKSPNVQPIQRPKDIVMGLVESWVTSGGNAGESNCITALRDEDGDGKPETRSVFLDHLASPFGVASPDGSLLYVGVGSNSNITENGMEAEENRAAIWEVERASGRWRIFASGLRNPNGLTFEPKSGVLWTVVNERAISASISIPVSGLNDRTWWKRPLSRTTR